ncbi:hypothetical protein SESBI_42055 [Sesbania bispinosa]|nr:hypothetical protein SESBI_42055 [Sesbania bispinosa]
MATRTGRLFQDQNLNAHVNGAGIVPGKADFTGQRKGRAGGRKPLGDLSNAGKPINQVDGKKAFDGSLKPLKSKNPNVIMNDEAFSVKAKILKVTNELPAKLLRNQILVAGKRFLTFQTRGSHMFQRLEIKTT